MLDDDMTATVTPFRRPGGNAWMGELSRNEGGMIHTTVANALIIMSCDAEISNCIAYDEFAHRIVVMCSPPVAFTGAGSAPGPYPRAIGDNDVTLLQGYVQRTYGIKITQPVALQALQTASDQNRIHPIRDWIDSLEWDGTPRLATWLHRAFGAPTDAYHTAIGIKFLAAAVRRIRKPGCKFDYVLVLEGKQGKGKSRACAALFGQDWFTDNLPHDLSSKDAQQAMAGRWGIELAELEALTKSSSGSAKAFFSRQVDYYRPSYGKTFVERPRQCVLIGTTNEADYLTDSTGNRRYWPLLCDKAEVAWIAEVREQLWAEAAVIEAEDEPLWLEQGVVERRAEQQQVGRQTEDVWTPRVRQWIADESKTDVHVSEILHDALGLPRQQQGRSAEMRVASILRSDGWMRHDFRPAGQKKTVRWFAPGQELPGRPGEFVAMPQQSE